MTPSLLVESTLTLTLSQILGEGTIVVSTENSITPLFYIIPSDLILIGSYDSSVSTACDCVGEYFSFQGILKGA